MRSMMTLQFNRSEGIFFSILQQLHGQITREFLVFKMRNFQDIVFIRTQTYGEISKCALVYL